MEMRKITQMKRSAMIIPADVTCNIRGLTALLYRH